MSDTTAVLSTPPEPSTRMASGREITKNTHSAQAFRAIWDRMIPGTPVQLGSLHSDAVRRGERISQQVLINYLAGKVNAGEARHPRKGVYERIAPIPAPAPAPAILPNPDPEPELPPPGTVERELAAAKARIAQLEVEVLELRAKLQAVPLAAEDARTAIARAVADLETARRELHGLL